METNELTKTKRVTVFAVLLILFFFAPTIMTAQTVTSVHFKERYLQLRSMEIEGEWNFHPGVWYVLGHRRYSGGSNFLSPKFNVLKSSVGHISPKRKVEIAAETAAHEHLKEDVKKIKKISDEETIRAAERQADEVYQLYSPVFKELNKSISDCLNAYDVTSQPDFLERSIKMKTEQDMLKEEIKYIHGIGPYAQCEQAKRELAYSDIKEKLEDLSERSFNMLLNAKAQANIKKYE